MNEQSKVDIDKLIGTLIFTLLWILIALTMILIDYFKLA